jgi:hypothetical protein
MSIRSGSQNFSFISLPTPFYGSFPPWWWWWWWCLLRQNLLAKTI